MDLEGCESFLNLLGLVQRPETPSADFHFYSLSIPNQRLLVDVGGEFVLGMSVGMADIITRHSIL